MMYRKKPVVVEAWPVTDLVDTIRKDGWGALPPVVRKAYADDVVMLCENGASLVINTLEGEMVGAESDMLICGVKGELYPCKRDIFNVTYEPAFS